MNKVLLVRLSSMGDLIHTFPALTDLACARPEVALSWLCEEAFVDIACLHPFIKNVFPMGGRRWRKSWWQQATRSQKSALKTALHNEHFEGVLDAQGLIKSALYARYAKAPIYGLDKKSAREPLSGCFYQHRYPVAWGQLAIERNRQLFAQVFQYDLPKQCHFGIPPPENDNTFTPLSKPYAVLLHATSQERKLWSENHWQQLAQRLWQEKQLMSFLPWGNPEEKERAQRLAINTPYIQVCPSLTLKQASVLLAQAQCVVGVDTGLLHLANALDKPLCGIYTDTDPLATGVLPTVRSVNLGNKGEIPSVDAVMTALQLALTDALPVP